MFIWVFTSDSSKSYPFFLSSRLSKHVHNLDTGDNFVGRSILLNCWNEFLSYRYYRLSHRLECERILNCLTHRHIYYMRAMKTLSFQMCFKPPVLPGRITLKENQRCKLDYAFKFFNVHFSFHLQLSLHQSTVFAPSTGSECLWEE